MSDHCWLSLASCGYHFPVTPGTFAELCSLCVSCPAFQAGLTVQAVTGALHWLPYSGQQLPEVPLPTSSTAAGINYTKKIKREAPIPRQLGHYRLSCFDYSH